MTRLFDDEQLTAFVLGELDGAERRRIESGLAADPESTAVVEDLQAAADFSAAALGGGAIPGLTDEQRVAIEGAAEAEVEVAPTSLPKGDSSVLYSLGNLNQLAVEQGDRATRQPEVLGEASGLVDIRTLAALDSGGGSADETGITELVELGAQATQPLGPGGLAPRKRMSPEIKIGLAVGGLFVAAVAVVVVALTVLAPRPDAAQQQIAALSKQLEQMQAAGSSAADIERIRKELMAARKAETEEAEQETAEGEGAAASDEKARAGSSRKSREKQKEPKKGASSRSTSSTSARSSKSSAVSTSRKGSGELDDLLGGAAKRPSPKRSSGSSSSAGGVKAALTRSDVQKGMNSVAASIKRCGEGRRGTITMKVVISETGRVSKATPTGGFAGSKVGTCAARAVRRARFPRSRKSTTVSYPFKF